MNEVLIGCIGLCLLLALFLTGIELAFAMTFIGFVGFAILRSLPAAVDLLAKDFFDTFASYAFVVVPLFVLMGQVAFNSGIAEKMYGTSRKFVGHVPGGLALATVVGATIFKAISGSSLATAATFSSVAIPEMDKCGYGRKLSTGVVASVGTLGILIPPSGTLIILAMITDQSIGKLFLAGIVPGLMIAAIVSGDDCGVVPRESIACAQRAGRRLERASPVDPANFLAPADFYRHGGRPAGRILYSHRSRQRRLHRGSSCSPC